MEAAVEVDDAAVVAGVTLVVVGALPVIARALRVVGGRKTNPGSTSASSDSAPPPLRIRGGRVCGVSDQTTNGVSIEPMRYSHGMKFNRRQRGGGTCKQR